MIDIDILRNKQIFFGLSDPQLTALAGIAEQRELKAGEILFQEGALSDTLALIVKGEIDLFRKKSDGGRTVLAKLGPGAVLGEMSLINIEPRSASAQAAVPVEAILLKNVDLAGIFKEDRELFIVVLMNITRILSKRLREANKLLR